MHSRGSLTWAESQKYDWFYVGCRNRGAAYLFVGTENSRGSNEERDVRYWHKADIQLVLVNVRFRG
mgnify:CR=1 FL=1